MEAPGRCPHPQTGWFNSVRPLDWQRNSLTNTSPSFMCINVGCSFGGRGLFCCDRYETGLCGSFGGDSETVMSPVGSRTQRQLWLGGAA